ncbi:MAG: 50S ribosomal protein L11 methyltransferase [Pseudomonadota bacterium]
MPQTRLYLSARKPELWHIASILDPYFEEEGITSVLFETVQGNGEWCYSVYVETDAADTTAQLMRDRLGNDTFGLAIEREELEDQDWVSQTLTELAPVRAGRFLVHGSHDRDQAHTARIAVEVDAGQAFGTGHHGTTAGCLDMLEHCMRQWQGPMGPPRRAMDIGTGSGVLAIALAKACPIPVLATDIDPIATHVARENCRLNGVASNVTCATATGFNNPAFARFGPADLIMANILARPLEALAPAMARNVTGGARVILSGLLPHQQARIVAAYRRQGMVFKHAHIRDGWLTLVMQA